MYFLNFIITFFSQIISVSASLLNNVIVARMLGPQGQGTMALIISFAGIFATFGSLGLTWSNTYWVARKKTTTDIIFSNSILFSLILMFVTLFFLKVKFINFIEPFITTKFFRIVLLAVPFLILTQLNQSVLLGLQKIIPYNLISIFRNLFLTVIFIFFTVILKMTVSSAVWIWFYVTLLVCCLSIYLVIRQLKNFKFHINLQVFTNSIKIGIKAFLSSLIAFLIMRLDFFIIRYFKGTENVGYYSVAVLFTEIILFIPQILGQLILPKGSGQEPGSLILALRVNRITVAYSLILGAFMILLIHPLLLTLFGRSFLAAQWSFILLVPGIIALNCTSTISSYISGSKDFPRQIILAILTALIVNILLDLLLVPKFGINGAAVASSVAYSISTCLCLNYFYFHQKIMPQDLLILKNEDTEILREKIKNILSFKK